MKPSKSQTLTLDGMETAVLLSDFAQQLRRKNADVPDIDFTLINAVGISPTLGLNHNAKAKEREEAGYVSKYERQKMQRLYKQCGAAYGPVRNLLEARNQYQRRDNFGIQNLPIKKLTLATRKFKRMKAFATFKNENWCMDLAYVDKLAKDNDGVKYLLVRQQLFDRTVDAKGMQTKDSKGRVRAFLTMITKKNRPKNIWVDKGTEIAGELKKPCKADGIQSYSTKSETKPAFAERKIRCLKNILHHYMEDNGYKYIHKMSQFVKTLNSRRNCSILVSEECEGFRLFVHSVQQTTTRI